MILKINDRIRNRRVNFFENFTLSMHYDSVASAFGFGFYFNPNNKEHVDLACIGHYHSCTVEHEGELLLTGTILSENFTSSSHPQMAMLGGYSLPGVLDDCNIPVSLYPLESNNLSLREIAQKLLAPFNIKMVVDSSVASLMDEVYEKTAANPTQSITSYLQELASQKNIILSHNEYGNLVFTRARTNAKPILEFSPGLPGTVMNLSFNGQAMHSDITVIKQAAEEGGNAGESTIKNPYVPYVFRPKVVIQSSGDDNSTEKAARNILSEELKNLKLIITTDRWMVNGKIIKPNNIVSVINPEVYLFKKTNLFIESVQLKEDKTKTVATLTCVLPEVYSGATPSYLFKGINLHG